MRCCATLLFAGLLQAASARAGPESLAVQVLGSGGPRPSAQASSGTLVLVDGVARILVDAGPGTLLRAGEQRVDFSALDTILLTHLHTDHAVELPSFATVRSLDGSGTTALRVFGPDRNAGFPSTRAFVAALLGPGGAFRYVRHFGAELTIEATNIPAGPRAAPKQNLARRGAGRDRPRTPPRRCACGRLSHRARGQERRPRGRRRPVGTPFGGGARLGGGPPGHQLRRARPTGVAAGALPAPQPALGDRRDGGAGARQGAALHPPAAGGQREGRGAPALHSARPSPVR